jgi:hypothetical protein
VPGTNVLSLICFPAPDRVPVPVHVCRARNWSSSSSACLIPVPAVQPLFFSSSFCLILLLSDPSVTVCPVLIQVVALRVSIHCQGCKKKVKKVLQNISGTRRTLLPPGLSVYHPHVVAWHCPRPCLHSSLPSIAARTQH